jgi:hypothetical protein
MFTNGLTDERSFERDLHIGGEALALAPVEIVPMPLARAGGR